MTTDPDEAADADGESADTPRGEAVDGGRVTADERATGADESTRDGEPATGEAAGGEPFVSVRDLRTYYEDGSILSRDPPVKAVDGVSFDVREGETLGLVGESGCGKTTLGRTLVGLESATGGSVRSGSRDVTDLSGSERRDWQRRVGMVFQDPEESLNDRQTVGEILREPLEAHDWPFLPVAVEDERGAAGERLDATVRGDAVTAAEDGDRADVTVRLGPSDREVDVRSGLPLARSDVSVTVERGDRPTVSVEVEKSKDEMRRDRAFALLERVGLNEEHFYRYPHQFSGGQRQRVGIARALALEPDFLVLDEPVSALDVSVQARIINLLEEIQAELGLTYLFIAHDLAVVRHIADRVAVMYLGNIVELGPAESVYTDPAHPYTLSLLSAIPGSGSHWSGERVTLRGTPPSPRDPPPGCPFATRCPAKIRPDDCDFPEETWRALDELRVVFRTRARGEDAAVATVKRLLGREVDADAVETAAEDLLGDRSLPPDAREIVDEAVELAAHGEDAEAAARLQSAFGSRCDEDHPEPHDRGDDWQSRCLRHEAGYREATETVVDREGRDGV